MQKQIFKISIPGGIGDILHIKSQLDNIKHIFSKIQISIYQPGIDHFRNGSLQYKEFIISFIKLIFNDSNYEILEFDNQPLRNCSELLITNGIQPIRPFLKDKLCQSLTNNYGEYITISTKIRQLDKQHYSEIKEKYFTILSNLSFKYKIMILGEKEIEYNSEYSHFGKDNIYSIYEDFIKYLPQDKIIDKSISKLGITAPNLENLLNDCSLMGNASYNICLGIGGNFCLAVAIGNTIGYRIDNDHIANILYDDKQYSYLFITKDIQKFYNKLAIL